MSLRPPSRDGVDRGPLVAVIGGGISGLACADRLRMLGVRPLVLEADPDAAGGLCRTEARPGGFMVERGPQWVADEPELRALTARLRIPARERLIAPRDLHVWTGERLAPALDTLSLGARLRAAWGLMFAGTPPGEDETAIDYARRRFGDEAARKIALPLVAAIGGGDPRLLVSARPLTRAASGGVRFLHFEGGAGTLTRALVASLGGAVRRGARVWSIEPLKEGAAAPPAPEGAESEGPRRWVVHVAGEGKERIPVAAVVIATPAAAAAALAAPLDAALAAALGEMRAADVTVAALGFDERALARAASCAAFLLPPGDPGGALGGIIGEAPAGKALVRVALAGLRDDVEAVALAKGVLARALGVSEEPTMIHVLRLPASLPRREAGHDARCKAIEKRLAALEGLHVCGGALGASGIGEAVVAARKVAERIADSM